MSLIVSCMMFLLGSTRVMAAAGRPHHPLRPILHGRTAPAQLGVFQPHSSSQLRGAFPGGSARSATPGGGVQACSRMRPEGAPPSLATPWREAGTKGTSRACSSFKYVNRRGSTSFFIGLATCLSTINSVLVTEAWPNFLTSTVPHGEPGKVAMKENPPCFSSYQTSRRTGCV